MKHFTLLTTLTILSLTTIAGEAAQAQVLHVTCDMQQDQVISSVLHQQQSDGDRQGFPGDLVGGGTR